MGGVIFDLDGTLTDNSEGIFACAEFAFAQMAVDPPSRTQMHAWVGPSLRQSLTTHLGGDAGAAERAIGLYRERYAEIGLLENTVYPGIESLLEELAENNVPMAVATLKPGVYAQRILEHFDLARFFQAIHGVGLDGSMEDKGALIRLALESLEVNASESIMIGDRADDMRGAAANGVTPIGVLWGFGSEEELARTGAEQLVSTAAQLRSQIKNLGFIDSRSANSCA